MIYVFANNVQTTLAAAATSTDTTLTLASSANLPTLAAGDIMPISLNDAATGTIYEICYVTAISGATLTVTRAEEGTTAQNWSVGDFAYSTNTAQTTGPTGGDPNTPFSASTITASGLITANGGLTVPSGETATVDGTLTIPNANATNEPVALGQ